MKQYFNSLRKSVWVMSALIMLASCSDWDDHYSYTAQTQNGAPVKSIAETIKRMDGTDDFLKARDNFIKVLQTTYMLNGEKLDKTHTYWNLLQDDQFLTVWVPTTVTDEEWAEYLAEEKDHKKVAREFIMNHIARFRHSVNPLTKERVYMLSEKSFESRPSVIGTVQYDADPAKVNIRCTNGIVHVLNGKLEYLPSIYDYLTKTSSYTKSRMGVIYDYTNELGKWFAKYTEEEIDEEKSVAAGYDDVTNEVKWADSVIIKKSILMDAFGLISEEDSNYAVVLPIPDVWSDTYDRISQSFEYGPLELDADSLQEFNTNYAMFTDLIFNMNYNSEKSRSDSVVSTSYKKSYNSQYKKAYNTYYKPYENGGLFQQRIDSVLCSNGIIYIKEDWPFEDKMLHRRPIIIEAESYAYAEKDNEDIRHPRRLVSEVNGQKLNNTFVAMLSHKNSLAEWTALFKVRNNLKGKYRLKFVIFPCETQKDAKGNIKPNLFHPIVKYMPEKKSITLIDSIEELPFPPFEMYATFSNDPTRIDTMDMGVVDFSTCNYDKDEQNEARISIELKSMVDDPKVNSIEMWLDCLILEPVFD